ncbi:MAG: hypothetical protein IPG13_05925 [Rhodocyclaceae bacterium]|nr:hypothetical protein [Rhodocyclaceae bacterium]
MAKKLCAACGKDFTPRPQVRNQSYCSAPECQLERHRRWQKAKRQNDTKYREIDAEYRRAWAGSNVGYWEKYREENPDYAERNRQLQRQRNAKTRKMKVGSSPARRTRILFALRPLPTHSYRLRRNCKR